MYELHHSAPPGVNSPALCPLCYQGSGSTINQSKIKELLKTKECMSLELDWSLPVANLVDST